MVANRDNWSLFRTTFSDRLGPDRGGGEDVARNSVGRLLEKDKTLILRRFSILAAFRVTSISSIFKLIRYRCGIGSNISIS